MKKKDLFKNIVSIRTIKNNVITFGTGFFIIAEDGEIYLVTASHVARDTLRSSDIWIQNLDTELPLAIKLGALSKNAIWIHHDVADIAILKVEEGMEESKVDLLKYAIPLKFFSKRFEDIPEREMTLTMYGTPDIYLDQKFAPFTCDCNPASDLTVFTYEHTGKNFKCFILDKPSIKGFSGGPVFLLNGDEMFSYGIVHGNRIDGAGGNLAIVVHSAYLFELIAFAKNE